jgi:hypothetical protein
MSTTSSNRPRIRGKRRSGKRTNTNDNANSSATRVTVDHTSDTSPQPNSKATISATADEKSNNSAVFIRVKRKRNETPVQALCMLSLRWCSSLYNSSIFWRLCF